MLSSQFLVVAHPASTKLSDHKAPLITPPDQKTIAIAEKQSSAVSETASSIVITYGQLKECINEYARRNLISWNSWVGTYLGKKLANPESELTKKLHGLLPSTPYNDSSQLNIEQLFELAYALYPALKEKNSSEIEAITPLIKSLGLMRTRMTHLITSDKNKSLHYFRILCKIPEEQVFYAGVILGLETQNIQLSSETIDLIIKNSNQLKGLFDLGGPILNNCGLNFTKLSNILSTSAFVVSFITSIIPHDRHSNQAIIASLINEIITSAFAHKTHVIDICYGILWLANHQIHTPENYKLLVQNPENLEYLSHIGMSYMDAKKNNREFNQKLFKFALDEGKKAVEEKRKISLSSQADTSTPPPALKQLNASPS